MPFLRYDITHARRYMLYHHHRYSDVLKIYRSSLKISYFLYTFACLYVNTSVQKLFYLSYSGKKNRHFKLPPSFFARQPPEKKNNATEILVIIIRRYSDGFMIPKILLEIHYSSLDDKRFVLWYSNNAGANKNRG